MQEKQIHIVFRVLNFLSGVESTSHNFTPNEKLLLLFLAKHKGLKGIYPSVKTLSRELKVSTRAIQYTLNYLVEKQVIQIERLPGKSNHYSIILPPTPEAGFIGQVSAPDSLPMKPTSPHLRSPLHPTPEAGFTLSEQLSNTGNKTERRKKRAPLLSGDFLPSLQAQTLCTERNLDLNFMTTKFKNYSAANGKTYADADAAFQLFVMNEKGAQVKLTNVVSINPTIVNDEDDAYAQCAGCLRPRCHCSCRLASKETNISKMGEILAKLNLPRKER